MKDLFVLVMEAEGDLLQPFDPNGPEELGDATTDANSQPSQQASGFDEPPPLSEDEELSFSDSDDGALNNDSDTDDNAEENKKDEKLSDKANNILNQQLYERMHSRNDEIEEIVNNIQHIIPVMPYEIVKLVDEPLNNLKLALNKGRKYVVDDFIDCGYGENLLFFTKLNTLYTTLLDSINKYLKKINIENNE